jgi:hypothetical protein
VPEPVPQLVGNAKLRTASQELRVRLLNVRDLHPRRAVTEPSQSGRHPEHASDQATVLTEQQGSRHGEQTIQLIEKPRPRHSCFVASLLTSPEAIPAATSSVRLR